MSNNLVDPARPETYPRRILLAVTGLSPQIVTETLYALAVQREPAFVPTEIHVISTAEGAKRVRLELLHKSTGHFKALCREYGLKNILFEESNIHTIRGKDGKPLEDIQTKQDNTLAADAITDLVRNLTQDEDGTSLHVSIAGGRKTMGFYLGYALSLYGRSQDRMSHVLVSPKFESNKTFFYPPKGSDVIHTNDNDPLDTLDAEITLAEIPFVRMRHGLSKKLRVGKTSFTAAVGTVQETLGPPMLNINVLETAVFCAGKRIKLSPMQVAFYAWLAEAKNMSDETEGRVRADTHSPARFVALYDVVGQNKRSTIDERYVWATKGNEPTIDQQEEWQKEFEQTITKINDRLREELGFLADQYLIHVLQDKPRKVYGLKLDPDQIVVADLG